MSWKKEVLKMSMWDAFDTFISPPRIESPLKSMKINMLLGGKYKDLRYYAMKGLLGKHRL